MGNQSRAIVAGLLGGLLAGAVARKLLPRERTDIDFVPPPQPAPDVIGGWERRPHVPTSDDIVR